MLFRRKCSPSRIRHRRLTSRSIVIASSCALSLLIFATSFTTTAFSFVPLSTSSTRNFQGIRLISIKSTHVTAHTSDNDDKDSIGIPEISEVDVLYNIKTPLQYDPKKGRFMNKAQAPNLSKTTPFKSLNDSIRPFLSSAFLPEGVNDSYFNYMRWRFLQRFVNANLHVIGTQSLLLGLGLKSQSSSLGVSAALNWVLKDALGKIARMLWASRMGRRFDSDAKRWRFRASLLYAFGNYLEIVTYINPQLFLLWASLANIFKQIAMLTSSSTRNTIYNSFRDGTRENIGDITAKGEAQIAIVDLCGIASGIFLSRAVGTAVRSILGAYVVLQVLEIFCMYHEIGSVEFRVLNFERLTTVIGDFIRGSSASRSSSRTKNDKNDVDKARLASSCISTPEEMAAKERLFWPPQHLSRRALAFGSFGRAELSPAELSEILKIFQNERFLLVVGKNTKNPKKRIRSREEQIQESCHIILHEDATNTDIVKSTLALLILRQKLLQGYKEKSTRAFLRSSDCFDLIADSKNEAEQMFSKLLREMAVQNWAPPSRFMFGRVHKRAYWPLASTS